MSLKPFGESRSMERTKPAQTAFMDEDMLALWKRMGPLPGDLRLYGGTALALYLNHRKSTDFDFATPLPVVNPEFVREIPVLGAGRINGGPGMVDVVLRTNGREVEMTFMECGDLMPMPEEKPIMASNGIAVAHPLDLVAAKIQACTDRAALRDHADIAESIRAWPDWSRRAAGLLTGKGTLRISDLQRRLADPPLDVVRKLSQADLLELREFGRSLKPPRRDRGMER